jgi:hypothetical protein
MYATPKLLLSLYLVTASFALAGCGGEAESAEAKNAEPPQQKLDDVQKSNTVSTKITAEYLIGAWCYRYYSSEDEIEEQNINHVFREDGTLLFQNNAQSQMNRIGDWSIDGDALIIDPTLAAFRTTVKSVEPDKFVLTGMVEHIFTRGSCSAEPV